jgi:hypothetical protein
MGEDAGSEVDVQRLQKPPLQAHWAAAAFRAIGCQAERIAPHMRQTDADNMERAPPTRIIARYRKHCNSPASDALWSLAPSLRVDAAKQVNGTEASD